MIKPKVIKKLSTQGKLRLMEAIWDDLSDNEELMEFPERHKEILDKREKQIQSGEAKFIDWEDAKEQINKATR